MRIAIDDFGTGYSNLSYLRKLPVDVIKLDGSFGERLREADVSNPVDERIVRTLVDLGHALDMTVCAEGVETAAQAARLRELGCDEGQGWHFAARAARRGRHRRCCATRTAHPGRDRPTTRPSQGCRPDRVS